MEFDDNWDGDYDRFKEEHLAEMLRVQANPNLHYHVCKICGKSETCIKNDCIYRVMPGIDKCPNCRNSGDFV